MVSIYNDQCGNNFAPIMSQKPHTALPTSIWTAFAVFTVVGVVVTALAGEGAISGIGFDVFRFGGLIVFVLWAVLRLDPRGLAELRIYKGR
jgi:hypothetical protein